MEIIGDLKKEFAEGKSPSGDRVKDFASKLFPVETVVNVHYKLLVKNNLLGNSVAMDGRPNVGIQKFIASSSGQKGFLVKETEEEKSIYKWKEGQFTEADRELSSLWRTVTTDEQVLIRLKQSLKGCVPDKIKDFDELNMIVNNHLASPDKQQAILLALIQNYDINPAIGFEILSKWGWAGKPLISQFAPYAFHCLRVDTLFLFGLSTGLIGTRATNRVDLEYLYYQPFGNIFTSNDKVHKNLAPLLLRDDQKFIVGTELKQGLKLIVDFLANLDPKSVSQFKNEPPIINESLVFQLWKEFFGYPQTSNWERKISDSEQEMMKRKADEFIQAVENNSIDSVLSDNAEFVVRKSYLSKNDPCYCGSGKRITDCCLPEDKFNEILRKQNEKKNK
ncbi:hypothetical protein GCM10023186_22200 [Hymenobacter koreensis]|uniref:SEC-C domain-containing protein n=2 Tax=Hymenobacter koreensis TaxID=1084523 RepID=A0ABP8J010_9BACT